MGLNVAAHKILGGHESLFRGNMLYLVSKSNFEIPHSLSANMCPNWDAFMNHYLEELCYIGCQRLNICDSGDIVAKHGS